VPSAALTTSNREIYDHHVGRTRDALREWRAERYRTVLPWLGLSLVVAVVILGAVLAFSFALTPDFRGGGVPQLGGVSDALRTWLRNLSVLLLHLLIGVATFACLRTLPMQAEHRHGWDRFIHRSLARPTLVGIAAAAVYSMAHLSITIGARLAAVSRELHHSAANVLAALLPHTIPELTAVFLPLGATLVVARRDPDRLIAAMAVCAAAGTVLLAGAAACETWVSPRLLAG
jgi:Stage II sporulation protein M